MSASHVTEVTYAYMNFPKERNVTLWLFSSISVLRLTGKLLATTRQLCSIPVPYLYINCWLVTNRWKRSDTFAYHILRHYILRVLCAKFICWFHMILRMNKIYFPGNHYLTFLWKNSLLCELGSVQVVTKIISELMLVTFLVQTNFSN